MLLFLRKSSLWYWRLFSFSYSERFLYYSEIFWYLSRASFWSFSFFFDNSYMSLLYIEKKFKEIFYQFFICFKKLTLSYEICKSYEYFYESLKIVWICFKYNIFCFQVFSKDFHEYIRMENLSYKIAWNHSEMIFIISIVIIPFLHEYIRMENLSYKIAWNHSEITWIVLNIFSIFKVYKEKFFKIRKKLSGIQNEFQILNHS